MSTGQTPRIPWLFLGGYLVFFVGLAVSLIGAFELAGASPRQGNPFVGGALAGAGAVAAAGGLLMARSEPIGSQHMAGLIVIFVMTPLPALVGLGINYLGNRMRNIPDAATQVILIAVGAFCLYLAGDWLWDVVDAPTVRQEFRTFAWAPLADIGLIALMLAVMPTFTAAPEKADET